MHGTPQGGKHQTVRGAERLCPLNKHDGGKKRKRRVAGTGAEEGEGARTNMSDDPLDMRLTYFFADI